MMLRVVIDTNVWVRILLRGRMTDLFVVAAVLQDGFGSV